MLESDWVCGSLTSFSCLLKDLRIFIPLWFCVLQREKRNQTPPGLHQEASERFHALHEGAEVHRNTCHQTPGQLCCECLLGINGEFELKPKHLESLTVWHCWHQTVLGPQWKSLSRAEQRKYYEEAEEQRLLHQQQHPGWSNKDNYVSPPWSHRRRAEEAVTTEITSLFNSRIFICFPGQNAGESWKSKL